MKLVFKRFGAYIIDILIVSIISALLSNIGTLNYQLDKYVDVYEKAIEVTEKYDSDEMSDKEYNDEIKELSYQMDKNSTISSIISVACLIGYFGIFQYSQNGRTIGKRIFKLQVKKYKDGNLNLINYLLRSLILNNIVFIFIKLVIIYTLSRNTYLSVYNVLSNVQLIFQFLIIVSIFISKEGRGIHDLIAGTQVIDLKAVDEFENGSNKKVIDGEIVK